MFVLLLVLFLLFVSGTYKDYVRCSCWPSLFPNVCQQDGLVVSINFLGARLRQRDLHDILGWQSCN